MTNTLQRVMFAAVFATGCTASGGPNVQPRASDTSRTHTTVRILLAGDQPTTSAQLTGASVRHNATTAPAPEPLASVADDSCPATLPSTRVTGIPTKSGYVLIFTTRHALVPLRVRTKNLMQAYDPKPEYQELPDGAALAFSFGDEARASAVASLQQDLREMQAGSCPSELGSLAPGATAAR